MNLLPRQPSKFRTPPALPPMPTAEQCRAHVRECLARIKAYDDPAVWIHRPADAAVWSHLDAALGRRAGGAELPLLGLTFAVKDNIDVAGMPTTAACPGFAYTPRESAEAVRWLTGAGAIVLGKANLDQFATGLVGTRSPYGACRNVFDGRYISGGSSSGSAVAVAAGLVDFSLGTDTAGSGRVPAAFNHLVGLKPTCGTVSTTGVVPACRSLDCVSVFAHTIDLAEKVFAVCRGFDPRDAYAQRAEELPQRATPAGTFRFGVPADDQIQFFGNVEAFRLYKTALARAAAAGGTAVTIDYAPFRAAAALLYDGPWVAERLAAIRPFFAKSHGALLPVTRQIIAGGEKFSAADAFDGQYRLRELRRAAEAELAKVDALFLPTAGTIYTVAEVEAEPITFNQNLGYYTNFVNLLDLCALAVPAGFRPDGLPFGVTFIGAAGADTALAVLARHFLAADPSPLSDTIA